MLVIIHAPREVMNRAHSPRAATRLGRIAHIDHAGTTRTRKPRPSVFGRHLLKPEHRREELGRVPRLALPHLRAEQPTNLAFARNRTLGPGRKSPRRSGFDERQAQAVRIDTREHLLSKTGLGRSDLRA